MAEPATAGQSRLAARLRQLRTTGFSRAVKQAELGDALGKVTATTVSTYEKAAGQIPPESRLQGYARFFATERSLDPAPHLVPDDELTHEESARLRDLERELLALREEAVRTAAPPPTALEPWLFPDDEAISIICPDVPETERPRMSRTTDPNFTDMLNYADLDALVELLPRISALNPRSEIVHMRASLTRPADLARHVVLLGGIAWNSKTERLLERIDLPVSQVKVAELQSGEIFEIKESGERIWPQWRQRAPGSDPELEQDAGLFARLPNPNNSQRTLTICTGIHSRGVLGAVQCFIDKEFRDANQRYLAGRFGRSDSYGLLMRVSVIDGGVLTPDLNQASNRLLEWPGRPVT